MKVKKVWKFLESEEDEEIDSGFESKLWVILFNKVKKSIHSLFFGAVEIPQGLYFGLAAVAYYVASWS